MKNKIYYIIGAILLGAIGSGFWEYIIKPTAISFQKIVLDISTLGMVRYKDQMYQQISENFHEENSLTILVLAFLSLTSIALLLSIFNLLKNNNKFCNYIMKHKIYKIIKKIQDKGSNFFILLYSLFVLVFFIITISQISYINRAITHYNQLNITVSPYINNEERLKIQSDFAQIKNRQDYVNIICKLQNIACQHNLIIKNFKIF